MRVHAGGACGIKDVNLAPYLGMTACGNIPIFKDGKGCGSCYEVPTIHQATNRQTSNYLRIDRIC
jgi:hypothetical protein